MEQLQAGVSHVTASAAAEGKSDVESAKATSASYIEQAKNLASSVITTAQVNPSAPRYAFVADLAKVLSSRELGGTDDVVRP